MGANASKMPIREAAGPRNGRRKPPRAVKSDCFQCQLKISGDGLWPYMPISRDCFGELARLHRFDEFRLNALGVFIGDLASARVFMTAAPVVQTEAADVEG